MSASTYHDWRRRNGKANQHNSAAPRTFWLLPWERAKIIEWHALLPDDGYRRLCYAMLDANAVAVSPATVYRVLRDADLLRRWQKSASQKGTGFVQPTRAHQHWHIDISYLNIGGTFYYLCSILDGYSRAIVGWDLAQAMLEGDVELVIQRALETYPGVSPRMISDNGPQFVARDFRQFVRLVGLTHVRTSPYYPQSNGKKERWYKTLKIEAIRTKTPLTLGNAIEVVTEFVRFYNDERLHSAIGYVPPRAMLDGSAAVIAHERKAKLVAGRAARVNAQQQLRETAARTRVSVHGGQQSPWFGPRVAPCC